MGPGPWIGEWWSPTFSLLPTSIERSSPCTIHWSRSPENSLYSPFYGGRRKAVSDVHYCRSGRFREDLLPDDGSPGNLHQHAALCPSHSWTGAQGIHVINSFQFKVISHSVRQADANDAEAITFFLSYGMLPAVWLKDGHCPEQESLANTLAIWFNLRRR